MNLLIALKSAVTKINNNIPWDGIDSPIRCRLAGVITATPLIFAAGRLWHWCGSIQGCEFKPDTLAMFTEGLTGVFQFNSIQIPVMEPLLQCCNDLSIQLDLGKMWHIRNRRYMCVNLALLCRRGRSEPIRWNNSQAPWIQNICTSSWPKTNRSILTPRTWNWWHYCNIVCPRGVLCVQY